VSVGWFEEFATSSGVGDLIPITPFVPVRKQGEAKSRCEGKMTDCLRVLGRFSILYAGGAGAVIMIMVNEPFTGTTHPV